MSSLIHVNSCSRCGSILQPVILRLIYMNHFCTRVRTIIKISYVNWSNRKKRILCFVKLHRHFLSYEAVAGYKSCSIVLKKQGYVSEVNNFILKSISC